MTGAVLNIPVGRYSMAGRVLRRACVMKVSDALVPVQGLSTSEVRSSQERLGASHFNARLEHIRDVRVALLGVHRRSLVHEEDRNRTRPKRDVIREILRAD